MERFKFKPKKEKEIVRDVFEERPDGQHLTNWAITNYAEDEWKMKNNDRKDITQHLLECEDCQNKVTAEAERLVDGKSRGAGD